MFRIQACYSENLCLDFGKRKKKHSNEITIITGTNGTGKSRLLANIVKYFGLALPNPERNILNEYATTFEFTTVPSKVIAQTFSPFSKFPAPFDEKSTIYVQDFVNIDSNIFSESLQYYLPIGFHKRSSVFSSNVVKKVIEESLAVLSLSNSKKGRPLSMALRHLNYKPEINIFYRSVNTETFENRLDDIANTLSNEIDEKQGVNTRFGFGGNYSYLRKALGIIGKEKVHKELLDAVDLLRRSHIPTPLAPGRIILSIDLEDLNQEKRAALRAMLLLRKTGFLRFHSLRLTQDNTKKSKLEVKTTGQPENLTYINKTENRSHVNIEDLSSGQLQLIGTLFSLATMLENNCLVAIDEPELSLHPKWQLDWLELLEGALQGYSGCHVFVATHSPLIATTAHDKGLRIISLEHKSKISNENADLSKNASIEETLTEVFETPIPNSSYLSSILFEAVTAANLSAFKRREVAIKLNKLEIIYEKNPTALNLIKDAKGLLDV